MCPIDRQQPSQEETNEIGHLAPTSSNATDVEENRVNDDDDYLTAISRNQAEKYYILHQSLSKKITLQTQADDEFAKALIEYLVENNLPNVHEKANKIIWQADNFVIIQQQIYQFARMPKKRRLKQIAERWLQLYVPRQFRYEIVKQTHEQTHYGFLKNYLMAKQKFFWFGMVEDFQLFAESCTMCQQIKPSKTEKFKMTSMPVYNFLDSIFINYHEIKLLKRERTPEAYKYV
jgi:hypothetical protein